MRAITAAGLLLLPTALGCDAELYHDLSERRANEALLALRESGVRADKRLDQRGIGGRPSSFALTVPSSEESRALRVLSQRGLPREAPRPPQSSSRLPLWPGDSRAETAAGLATTLTDTLESLPEVQEARVHLALPDADPLGLGRAEATPPAGNTGPGRPTASVLLRLRAPLPLTAGAIADLVARSVPGLRAEDVTVVTAPASASPTQASAPPPAGSEARRLVRLGPLWVAAGSQAPVIALLALLGGLLGLCAVLVRLVWPQLREKSPAEPLPEPLVAPAVPPSPPESPASLTATSGFSGAFSGLSSGPLSSGLSSVATNLAGGAPGTSGPGGASRAPR